MTRRSRTIRPRAPAAQHANTQGCTHSAVATRTSSTPARKHAAQRKPARKHASQRAQRRLGGRRRQALPPGAPKISACCGQRGVVVAAQQGVAREPPMPLWGGTWGGGAVANRRRNLADGQGAAFGFPQPGRSSGTVPTSDRHRASPVRRDGAVLHAVYIAFKGALMGRRGRSRSKPVWPCLIPRALPRRIFYQGCTGDGALGPGEAAASSTPAPVPPDIVDRGSKGTTSRVAQRRNPLAAAARQFVQPNKQPATLVGGLLSRGSQ